MKPLVVLGLVAAAAGGYFWYSANGNAPVLVPEQAVTTPSVVEQAAEEAVESATETAPETATETANEAVESATEAVESATEGVEEAIDAVSEAAEQSMEAATEAAETAIDAATEAVDTGTDMVTDGIGSLLTADGFDLDQVVTLIDGSSLDSTNKMLLTTAVTQAQDNPELLAAVLQQVKSALGL